MIDETNTAPQGTAAKILVVEDDQFLARAITSKLKKEGFAVLTLRNGEEALEALKESVPDMLLLDLITPKKSGFEVLEEIRADERFKELPIMVLSNLSQAPDTAATEKLGVLEHLVKADTPLADIIERVKHHLQSRT